MYGGSLSSSRLFVDFVDAQDLHDVLISRALSPGSMQLPPILSKLDRFLLSAEWDMAFHFSKGVAKPHLMSAHIPLVLCGKMAGGAPKPFKFENMWL